MSDGDDYVDPTIAQMFENKKRCKLKVHKKNQDADLEAATCDNEKVGEGSSNQTLSGYFQITKLYLLVSYLVLGGYMSLL